MTLFNKILPFLSAVLIVVVLEVWLAKPQMIYYAAGSLLLIVIISIWQITGRGFFKKTFWNFLFTPLLLVASGFILFLLLESVVVKQIFIFGLSLIFYLITYNIRSFLYQAESYQPYALENIYSYVNLLTSFMFYASFFGLYLFLDIPYWLTTIITFLVSLMLIYRTLWANKIEWSQGWLYIIAGGFVLAESFWVISFVPLSYFVAAFILMIIYYLVFSFIRDHLLGKINPRSIKKYIIVSIVSLAVVLITSQWY